ncbi:ssDNA-binding protein [Ochrobactrum sp. A-1]|uniref:ssDNA-binding protein n=1 Tax=Ochrobactrum sp. A-1 TaxID=2920940 RepID=UPI001F0AC9C8|nr:DUF2815 family protein [Ochrobactrum sp. A-1]
MAKSMYRTEEFKAPDCVVSFAFNMFKGRELKKDDGSTKTQFGATFIFEDIHRPFFEEWLKKAIIGEWGEKGLERAKAGLIKSPLLSGTGKEARNKETGDLHPGMGEGKFFIRANANEAPQVRWKSPIIPATEQDVYSGCRGFPVLNAYTWHNDKNGDGVSFGLQYFQKTGEGERIGSSGGVDVNKWYEKVETGEEAPESTSNGAGAGGLFG